MPMRLTPVWAAALLDIGAATADSNNESKRQQRHCTMPPESVRPRSCFSPIVAQDFCYAPDKCSSWSDVDACTVVTHGILAYLGTNDAVLLPLRVCQTGLEQGPLLHAPMSRASQVDTLLPGKDRLVNINVNGSDLLLALEHGIDQFHVHNNTDAYPKVAGLRFQVNMRRPFGRRIAHAQILHQYSCQWIDLRPYQQYRIATIALIANGGWGYGSLTRGTLTRQQPQHETVYETFVQYAKTVCNVRNPFHGLTFGCSPESKNLRKTSAFRNSNVAAHNSMRGQNRTTAATSVM